MILSLHRHRHPLLFPPIFVFFFLFLFLLPTLIQLQCQVHALEQTNQLSLISSEDTLGYPDYHDHHDGLDSEHGDVVSQPQQYLPGNHHHRLPSHHQQPPHPHDVSNKNNHHDHLQFSNLQSDFQNLLLKLQHEEDLLLSYTSNPFEFPPLKLFLITIPYQFLLKPFFQIIIFSFNFVFNFGIYQFLYQTLVRILIWNLLVKYLIIRILVITIGKSIIWKWILNPPLKFVWNSMIKTVILDGFYDGFFKGVVWNLWVLQILKPIWKGWIAWGWPLVRVGGVVGGVGVVGGWGAGKASSIIFQLTTLALSLIATTPPFAYLTPAYLLPRVNYRIQLFHRSSNSAQKALERRYRKIRLDLLPLVFRPWLWSLPLLGTNDGLQTEGRSYIFDGEMEMATKAVMSTPTLPSRIQLQQRPGIIQLQQRPGIEEHLMIPGALTMRNPSQSTVPSPSQQSSVYPATTPEQTSIMSGKKNVVTMLKDILERLPIPKSYTSDPNRPGLSREDSSSREWSPVSASAPTNSHQRTRPTTTMGMTRAGSNPDGEGRFGLHASDEFGGISESLRNRGLRSASGSSWDTENQKRSLALPSLSASKMGRDDGIRAKVSDVRGPQGLQEDNDGINRDHHHSSTKGGKRNGVIKNLAEGVGDKSLGPNEVRDAPTDVERDSENRQSPFIRLRSRNAPHQTALDGSLSRISRGQPSSGEDRNSRSQRDLERIRVPSSLVVNGGGSSVVGVRRARGSGSSGAGGGGAFGKRIRSDMNASAGEEEDSLKTLMKEYGMGKWMEGEEVETGDGGTGEEEEGYWGDEAGVGRVSHSAPILSTTIPSGRFDRIHHLKNAGPSSLKGRSDSFESSSSWNDTDEDEEIEQDDDDGNGRILYNDHHPDVETSSGSNQTWSESGTNLLSSSFREGGGGDKGKQMLDTTSGGVPPVFGRRTVRWK